MEGSRLPVVVSPRRGGPSSDNPGDQAGRWRRCATSTTRASLPGLPLQPQRFARGLTAVTTADGRFTIMMPHPERVFRTVQMSWHPKDWGDDSPWMRLFRNARRWVG